MRRIKELVFNAPDDVDFVRGELDITRRIVHYSSGGQGFHEVFFDTASYNFYSALDNFTEAFFVTPFTTSLVPLISNTFSRLFMTYSKVGTFIESSGDFYKLASLLISLPRPFFLLSSTVNELVDQILRERLM